MALLDAVGFSTGLISSASAAATEFDAISVVTDGTFSLVTGRVEYAFTAATSTTAGVSYGERDWGSDHGTIYLETFLTLSGTPSAQTGVLTLLDSSSTVIGTLRLTASGNWAWYNAGDATLYTGTGQIARGESYRVELKLVSDATAGTIDLKINGILHPGVSGLTGKNTRPGGLPRKYRIGVTESQASAPSRSFDHVIVRTDDWVGRATVLPVLPVSDSSPSVPPPSGTSITAPTDLSGCILWLDSDTSTYWQDTAKTVPATSAGNLVQAWADKSGIGHDATTTNSAERPAVVLSTQNGRPGLSFGSGNGLVTSLSLALPYTIFIVYSRDNAASGASRALQGSNNWLIGPYSNAYQCYNGSGFLSAGPTVTVNQMVIHDVDAQTGSTRHRVGGTTYGTAVSANAPGTVGLGVRGAFAEALLGRICEVIIYSSVLSDADRYGVQAYLGNKYALAYYSTVGWTPVTGTTLPACLVERPWASLFTDEIKCSAANAEARLRLAGCGSPSAIYGLVPVVRHARTTAGSAAAVTLAIRSGSTTGTGTSVDSGSNTFATLRGTPQSTDPATGSAWTATAANAAVLSMTHDAGTNEANVNAALVYAAVVVDGALAPSPLTAALPAAQSHTGVIASGPVATDPYPRRGRRIHKAVIR